MNLQPKKENNSPLKSKRIADGLTLPCFVNKSLTVLKKLETAPLFVGRIVFY